MVKKIFVFLFVWLLVPVVLVDGARHNPVNDGGMFSGFIGAVFNITSWRMYARTSGDWYEVFDKLEVSFYNASDSASKVSLRLLCDQGSPVFADYSVNMSIDGEFDSIFQMGNDIILQSHCLRVVFNYWDLSRISGLSFRFGLASEGVFYFVMSRNHVRDNVYLYDPTYVVSAGAGDITGLPSERMLVADSSQKLHTVLQKFVSGGNDIYYCNSTDTGATWSAGKCIEVVSLAYGNYGKSIVVNRSNDDIYIVYAFRYGTKYFLKLAKSTDSGLTWTYSHVNGSSFTRRMMYPTMCITYDNKLMIFFEYYNAGRKYEIQCRWYNFSNSSWSSHFLVSNTPTYNQYYPSCAVSSSTGDSWVAWHGNHGGSTTYTQVRVSHFSNSSKSFVFPVVNLTSGSYHSEQPSMCANWSGAHIRIAFHTKFSQYQIRMLNITASDGALGPIMNVSRYTGYENSEPNIGVDEVDNTYVIWDTVIASYELRLQIFVKGSGWGSQDNLSFQDALNSHWYGNIIHGVKSKCYPYSGCMFVWTNSSNDYFYVSSGFEWDHIVNYVPYLTGLFPLNNSWEISCYPKMNITAVDRNGDGMTVGLWASNDSVSWYHWADYVLGGNMTIYPVNPAFNESYTYYYWNVTVTDYVNTNSSGVYHFHTGNCSCFCEEVAYSGLWILDPNPANGTLGTNYIVNSTLGLTTGLDVYCDYGFDGIGVLNITFLSNSSGAWLPYGQVSNIVANGTYSVFNVNFSDPDTVYWWNVTITMDDVPADSVPALSFTTGNCSGAGGAAVYIPLGSGSYRNWLVWFILGGCIGLIVGLVLWSRRKKV